MPDGRTDPIRMRHRCERWQKGQPPHLVQLIVEGDPGLGV
jgi:hypothetical protein